MKTFSLDRYPYYKYILGRGRKPAKIVQGILEHARVAPAERNPGQRAAHPTNVDEFQERWGSVSDVSDGKCTPRPRKLETEMEPD